MKTSIRRISWIDNSKFVAIFCVILGHSFSLIKGDFHGYDDINLLIVAFNMPLFALLSGFTSYRSLIRINLVSDLITYLNKISWHIGVPTVIYTLIAMSIGYGMQLRWSRCFLSTCFLFIVCLLVYLFVFSKYSSKLDKVKVIFPYLILPICLINQSVWYFVYVIFSLLAAALASYIANRIGYNKRIVFCILFALFSFLFAPFSPFFSTVELFLPFFVGYMYSSYRGLEKFSNENKKLNAIAIFGLLIGLLAFVNYYSVANQFYLLNLQQAFESYKISIFLIRQLSAISLSIAIVALVQYFSSSYTFISTIGTMTFGLYPIHSEFIGIIKNYLGKISMGGSIDIMFVLLSAVTLLISSILLIRLIRKSQYCKLMFLGE